MWLRPENVLTSGLVCVYGFWGKPVSKLIQVVGRIEFFAVSWLRSLRFFSGSQLLKAAFDPGLLASPYSCQKSLSL